MKEKKFITFSKRIGQFLRWHIFTKKKIKRFLLYLIYDFSGIRFIWSKILPPKETTKINRKPSTFIFWIVGIYVALYGITSQRYENRIDIIENRANSMFTQLSPSTYKNAISRIPIIQMMKCPKKPVILKPGTVFSSLLGGKTFYNEIIEVLQETLVVWKEKLNGVNLNFVELQGVYIYDANLQGAYLHGANLQKANLDRSNLQDASLWWINLQEANLQGANLKGADLMGAKLHDAKGLTLDMLLEVKTLYEVEGLKPELEEEIKACKPELFDNPLQLLLKQKYKLPEIPKITFPKLKEIEPYKIKIPRDGA